jgi:hypothetical protein
VRSRPANPIRRYGAQPLRLLALLGCFALAGYAVVHVPIGTLPRIVVWFGAAIVAHDLLLFPAYALADRILSVLARAARRTPAARRIPLINYVRTPALASALLLALFLPGIIRQGARTYRVATGQTQQPFLARWLLLSIAMFAAGAGLYALRLHRATAPRRAAIRGARRIVGRHERVLAVAFSPGTDTPAVAATTRALWLRPPTGSSWQRLGWEDLAELTTTPQTLHVSPLPGGGAGTAVAVDEPERLAGIGRDQVAATRVLTRRVHLGPGEQAEVALRRRPGTTELVWRVHLDPHSDPTDPGTRQRLDEALTALRRSLGLDAPSDTESAGRRRPETSEHRVEPRRR